MIEGLSGLWAMEPKRLADLVSLINRLGTDLEASSGGAQPTNTTYSVTDGVARIPVHGTLLRSVPTWFSRYGISATSTVELAKQILEAADDAEVQSIELDIDSPGGQVSGTGEAADALAVATSKKPTVAKVSSLAASAAYWIASQASVIEASQYAEIGSIGVYTVMVDSSAAAEQAGVKVIVVASGEHKGAGVDGAPITDAQVEVEQELIDRAAQTFVSSVATGRGVDAAQIEPLATGRVWYAPEAVELGLIDAAVDAVSEARRMEELELQKQEEAANAARCAELEAQLEELKAAKEEEAARASAAEAAVAEAKRQQRVAVIEAHADRIAPSMREHVESFADACGDDVEKLKGFLGALPTVVHPEPVGEVAVQPEEPVVDEGEVAVAKSLGVPLETVTKWGAVKAIRIDGKLVLADGSIVSKEEF